MSDKLACGCIPGSFLCPEAERLWADHNGTWRKIVTFQRQHNWLIAEDHDVACLNDLEVQNRETLAQYRAHVGIGGQ